MGNGTILSELDHDAGAPARLIDTELHMRIEAMHKAPQVAPGLLAWIDAAANWEKNCRAGHDYELLPPEAAIDPSKNEVSINAAWCCATSSPRIRRRCGRSSMRWWNC